jgi:hypothetical protein
MVYAIKVYVGHILFLLPGIHATPAGAGAKLPGNRSEGRLGGGAIAETGQTGSKDGSEDAVARRSFDLVDNARPVTFAILAGFGCHSNGIRSVPLHF